MMRAAMIMTVKTSVMRGRHSLGVAGSAMTPRRGTAETKGLIGTNSNALTSVLTVSRECLHIVLPLQEWSLLDHFAPAKSLVTAPARLLVDVG